MGLSVKICILIYDRALLVVEPGSIRRVPGRYKEGRRAVNRPFQSDVTLFRYNA